jgi:iron complex outermembrane recepter protein
MFKYPGTTSLPIAALVMAATAATAQNAPSNGRASEDLQEIVVTGSILKRTDTETPSPVQIITADDLKNSGYTNVSDVLRNLPANGQGTLNQAFGQAFAFGGSGIALRGLTVGGTLTLIDSERMVAYPLSDDGQRSFVDVSALPFNAIDSIEVLKDGASALYGADAIAGVINIKLKKLYVGTDLTAEGGTSQHGDGTTRHLAGITGWGDLPSDGYNFYLAVDWHRTDKILGFSRSAPFTNLDWSGLPGGVNTTPGTPASNNLTYPDSLTGYLLNPTTASGQPYAFLPGCTQPLLNADKCGFTFPGVIQPRTGQASFLSKLTLSLADNWTATVSASVFDSQATEVAASAFGHAYPSTGYNNGGIVNIPFGPGLPPSVLTYPIITLPATSPLNPFGVAAPLIYNFPDVGPQVFDVDTRTYRLFGDLKGEFAGWDLDGTVGAMYALMDTKVDGELAPGALQAALDDGAYVPGQSTNGIQLFAPTVRYSPSSTLGLVDFHGSRDLLQLPGGPLALGTGVQYIHKAQNAVPAEAISTGVQEGPTAFTVGSQDDTAGFIELDAKVLKQLELNGAVRYDHYDTYGGSATPKFGFKFTPVDSFAVRGTWGRGFRAPSISESGSSGAAMGAGLAFDPVLCPGGIPNVKGTFNSQCAFPLIDVQSANPALKAVTSTNLTFGALFEPAKAFNVSVDYYRIQLNNDILPQLEVGGVTNYSSLVRGAVGTQAICTNTVTTGTCAQQTVTTPVGLASYATYPFVNAGATRTSGIDVDLRSGFDAGEIGKFSAELSYTYVLQYEFSFAGQTFDEAGTHGPSEISGDTGNPKQRMTASLTWSKGPASVTGSVNYTGAFNITDPAAGIDTCLQALTQRQDSSYGAALSPSVTTLPSQWYQYCSVHHFTDVNLYASYSVTDHLLLHGSITNLFDSNPPVDLQTYGGGAELAYDAPLHQDGAVGRFFLLGVTYRF